MKIFFVVQYIGKFAKLKPTRGTQPTRDLPTVQIVGTRRPSPEGGVHGWTGKGLWAASLSGDDISVCGLQHLGRDKIPNLVVKARWAFI